MNPFAPLLALALMSAPTETTNQTTITFVAETEEGTDQVQTCFIPQICSCSIIEADACGSKCQRYAEAHGERLIASSCEASEEQIDYILLRHRVQRNVACGCSTVGQPGEHVDAPNW